MIDVKNISQAFVRRGGISVQALQDVSFSVKDGEFVAIVGPSGCGKTTLLRVIAGLQKPTRGTISLDGLEIDRPSDDLGMVFQQSTLFPWLTVEENIAFGLVLKHQNKEAIQGAVNKYLTVTGLNQFKDAYPRALSGGMQQRVAIARTLANNPKAVMLDEPFAALDVQARSQMQEFLANLQEQEQKTSLLVTHDIEEAIYLADRIVLLSTKPGTVKEIVPVDLPRPRRGEIRFSDEFVKLKKYISYTIRSESIKAATDLRSFPSSEKKFIIASNIWPGIAPLYLAKEKGLFDRRDLNVELATVEWSDDRFKPLIEDSVDVLNIPLDTALVACRTIPELRIIMPTDLSYGGDALLVKRSIESVKDLIGKKVGVEKQWVGHYFLLYILDRFGLSSRDVLLEDIKTGDIGANIIAGRIDAGVTQEPWLSKTKELADIKELVDSKEYPLIYSVLVAKRETLIKKADEVEKLKLIWRQAVGFYDKNKLEAVKIMAPYLGMSEVELAEQLEGLRFAKDSSGLPSAIQKIETVLLKEKIITKPIDVENLIWNDARNFSS
jgi:ABC-type nitrate/sulfonate/bicarbonate transport system ATPase subunit/ABC-type nitrate/sulfonate/bicarbonate transport system substrate-binding protein